MRVLLDESVPRAVKKQLEGHDVETVQCQQNLSARKLFVVILPANRVPDVLRLVPEILKALAAAKQGSFVEIAG